MSDFRSDTVTLPTESMRAAISSAKVGDDVAGEDPTINSLEKLVSDMCGKEAAVFVPSGTMGNLISLLAHCGRGDEVILGDMCHIFLHERGGIAALGGIHSYPLKTQKDGTLLIEDIRDAIRDVHDIHNPRTRLLCLEQAHNFAGGKVLPIDYIDQTAKLAHENGLAVHVDGARLFNACVASSISPQRMLENVDSVSICLSKGLCAPVGSVVVGDAEFIHRARQWRKAVGGGMRQAGIIAAGGIVALNEMIERLKVDHDNAKLFGKLLGTVDKLHVEAVDSNIVVVDLPKEVSVDDFVRRGESRGVLFHSIGPHRVRFVTHFHISDSDVRHAAELVKEIARELLE